MNRFIKEKQQLGIFVTAGFPDLGSTVEQILFLQDKGVDFIEIGMPFSDPMADGPVIQKSSMAALKNGMNMKLLFTQLSAVMDKVRIPVVLMGYLNPVLRYGLENFFSEAKACGIAGIIIPDLSPELYAQKYAERLGKFNLPLIHLITPETTDDRIKEIAVISGEGFVYLVSSNSTTGSGQNFDLRKRRYTEIKKICSPTPVFIGFGVRSAADRIVLDETTCNGHIIGSEYIRVLENGQETEFIDRITSRSVS